MLAVIGFIVACLASAGIGFAVGLLLRATGDVTVTEYRACAVCGTKLNHPEPVVTAEE